MIVQRANWKALFIAGGSEPALKPMYLRWAVLLSLLLAFALGLYRLGYQSIWSDEGYSINISAKSLSDIASTTAIDIHPPFYYWLLHFWMPMVGKTEFSIRFLSLIFGVATVALVYRLGLRLLGQSGAFLAAFLAAVSPFLIAYNQEARMYTLETLLGLVSIYLLTELFIRHASPHKKHRLPTGCIWSAYVLATVLALYADYFSAAIVVFQNFFVVAWAVSELVRGTSRQEGWENGQAQELALQRSGRSSHFVLGFLLRWAFAQLTILVLYLPWLFIAIRQVRGYGFGVVTSPGLVKILTHLFGAFNIGVPFRIRLTALQVPTFFAPSTLAVYLGLAAAVLVIGLTLSFWRKSDDEHERLYWSYTFLLCSFLVPIAIFLIVLRFRPYFHPRYMLVVLPSYLLLLALALKALWRKWKVVAILSLGAILMGQGAAIHSHFFDPAFAKEDARSTACFLAEEATVEDLVLWEFNNYALEYYYQGVAPARGIAASLDTTAEELGRLAHGRKRVFWVTWVLNTDPWGMIPFLLEKNGGKVGERGISGHNVQWYALSPEWSFSQENLQSVNINFEDKIALTGVAFGGEKDGPSLASGEAAWVALRWECLNELEDNLKFYVHINDKEGRLVGQDDGFLLNAASWKTPLWKEGDITYGFATPQIEPGTPPGDYSIEVGVYVAETLDRLSVGTVGRPDIVGSLQVLPPSIPLTSESLKIEWPLSARFGEIELLGYEQEVSQVRQGDFFPVTLFWHAIQQPQHDLDIAIDLVDEGGVAVKKYHLPISASYPTSKWRMGEAVRGQYSLLIPADLPGGEWRLQVSVAQDGQGTGEPVLLSPFGVTVRQRSTELPEAIQHPLTAEVGHFATFLGYAVDKVEIKAGDTLNLTLYWRARATAGKRYTVFTHLIDGGNRVWGQRDSMPQAGEAPTTSWLEGEVIVDTYQIPVRPDCPLGEYRIEIGMYYLETEERLPVDGEDHLLLGAIRVIET